MAQSVEIDDFGDDHQDHTGLGFLGGVGLHVEYREASDWCGRDEHVRARAIVRFQVEIFRAGKCRAVGGCLLTVHDVSLRGTYLDLDPTVRDPLGDAVCRVTSGAKPNEARSMAYGQDKMEEWFRAAGAIAVVKTTSTGPILSTHAFGGTRMGDDRRPTWWIAGACRMRCRIWRLSAAR